MIFSRMGGAKRNPSFRFRWVAACGLHPSYNSAKLKIVHRHVLERACDCCIISSKSIYTYRHALLKSRAAATELASSNPSISALNLMKMVHQ